MSATGWDCYDAIETTLKRHHSKSPEGVVATTAQKVADLWNDPPTIMVTTDVREVCPELADALDELLGGGPSS